MATNVKHLAIDLFSGVGGMSLGFEQAGFRIAAAFDIEERHVATYNSNFSGHRATRVNLACVSSDRLRDLGAFRSRDVDVVFGGPPCQGFSIGGFREADDPRNRCVMSFARIVRQLEPKYFVMENVSGLLGAHASDSLNRFIKSMKGAGYLLVEPIRTLDAADFGVPQRRERVFVLGHRPGVPAPSYPSRRGMMIAGRECFPTVSDAINDLPCIEDRPELFDTGEYHGPLGKRPSRYAKLMRGQVADRGDKSPKRRRNSALTGCSRTHHAKAVTRRFAKTEPGEREPVSRFFRLKGDSVAPTIRAGTGLDRGRHTAPRPIHHELNRCITVREAARLFGYPDWFSFHETRWHAFRQIGNSVPPPLARAVAMSVGAALRRSGR